MVFSSVTRDIKQVGQDLQAEMRPGLLFVKRAEGLLCFFSVIGNIQPHGGEVPLFEQGTDFRSFKLLSV